MRELKVVFNLGVNSSAVEVSFSPVLSFLESVCSRHDIIFETVKLAILWRSIVGLGFLKTFHLSSKTKRLLQLITFTLQCLKYF